MNTKLIAILVIASLMLVYGVASVSATDYYVWCKNMNTGKTYCGYSKQVTSCYVQSTGGNANPLVTPCSWSGIPGYKYVSKALKTPGSCPPCTAGGSNWANAYAGTTGCGCYSG